MPGARAWAAQLVVRRQLEAAPAAALPMPSVMHMAAGTAGSQFRSRDVAMLLRSVATLIEPVQEAPLVVLSQHPQQ